MPQSRQPFGRRSPIASETATPRTAAASIPPSDGTPTISGAQRDYVPYGKAGPPEFSTERGRRKDGGLVPISLSSRIILYGGLGGLTWLAFNQVILIFAFFTLVVPGLILILAPLLLIYLPILDFPYLAWRYTRRPVVIALAFAMALTLPIAVPLIVNHGLRVRADQILRTSRYEAIDVTDIPLRRSASLPRTVLLSGRGGCDDLCDMLLASGALDHVLTVPSRARYGNVKSATLVSLVPSDDCSAAPGAWHAFRHRTGWCLVHQEVVNPRFDAMVDFQVDTFDHAAALNAWGKADYNLSRGVTRISVWDCPADCTLIGRRSQVDAQGVAWPFRTRLGFSSNFPIVEIASAPIRIGDADIKRVLLATLGLDLSVQRPLGTFNGPAPTGGMPALDASGEAARSSEEAARRARWAALKAQSAAVRADAERAKADMEAVRARWKMEHPPSSTH